MAVRSVTSGYFSEERTIGAAGSDTVELTEPCSAIIIQFHPGAVNYTLELNPTVTQGAGPQQAITYRPGNVLALDNWRVYSLTVTGAVGATWSYTAFIKPRTGLGFSVTS